MKLSYMFNTARDDEGLWVDGLVVECDSTTNTTVIVVDHGDAELDLATLREFIVALNEIADRLEPPKPKVEIKLHRAINSDLAFPGFV